MTTNLPPIPREDNASSTKLFFDSYGITPLEFSAIDVNSATAFFESKGFSKDAALVIATAILKQAKLDGIEIYKILDSITNMGRIELNILVGEILNNNRVPTSSLGFKSETVLTYQTRNITA